MKLSGVIALRDGLCSHFSRSGRPKGNNVEVLSLMEPVRERKAARAARREVQGAGQLFNQSSVFVLMRRCRNKIFDNPETLIRDLKLRCKSCVKDVGKDEV